MIGILQYRRETGLSASRLGSVDDTAVRLQLTSKHDDRDPLIAATQVGIAFQLRLRLQQAPGRVVAPRPVFPKDAAANLTALR